MKNIYLQIADRQSVNSSMALATITGTVGSSPQKPGSSALYDAGGLLSGTVGGGIVEAKVQQIAQTAIVSKRSGFYHFNLDNDISQQEEPICGGQINILLDAAVLDHMVAFDQLKQSLLQRIPGVLVTEVTHSGNEQVRIHRFWITQNEKTTMLPDRLRHLKPEITRLFADGTAGDYREFTPSHEEQQTRIFLEPILPLPRLVIAGAGHIGKALAHLGSLLEFEVMVIDERADYANPENIPDADHFVVDDIGRAMQSLHITSDTYIVIVTRGHKNDADALKPCIGSAAAYVGMIGSTKKVALMRKNFIAEGLTEPADWESVYAPIGLDIHSKTVQEIAISIAAQLTGVRNHAHA